MRSRCNLVLCSSPTTANCGVTGYRKGPRQRLTCSHCSKAARSKKVKERIVSAIFWSSSSQRRFIPISTTKHPIFSRPFVDLKQSLLLRWTEYSWLHDDDVVLLGCFIFFSPIQRIHAFPSCFLPLSRTLVVMILYLTQAGISAATSTGSSYPRWD